MECLKQIQEEIERIRLKLIDVVESKGTFLDEEVLKLSRELDEWINLFHNKENGCESPFPVRGRKRGALAAY